MRIGRHEVKAAVGSIIEAVEEDVHDASETDKYAIGSILEAQISAEIDRLLTVAGVQIEEPVQA